MYEGKIAVELNKEDLINLCKSCPIPMGGIEGMTDFTGNQHNPDWRWKDSVFKDMGTIQLWDFYREHRK